MRDYPNSQDMLERVLSLDEGDAASWLDLGDVLFMMGDENQARSSWEQAGLTDATK
jgi:predicted negative regulator of RcsB-dependent stress response